MVMSKFKTIALYSSKDDHKVSIIGSQLVEIFSNMGIRVLIAKSSTDIDSRIKRTYSERYIVEKADLLISIGGDGTLLSAARIFGARGLPLMGINVGNIGFLTDISPDDLTNSVKDVLNGNFTEDRRFFLEAKINGQVSGKDHLALNEIVIHSGTVAQLIEYELFMNDAFGLIRVAAFIALFKTKGGVYLNIIFGDSGFFVQFPEGALHFAFSFIHMTFGEIPSIRVFHE